MDLNKDLKEAMLAKDPIRVLTVKAIKTAFSVALTEKGAMGTLTPEQEIKIVQKLFNQRKESFEIFTRENRLELAEREKQEMDILAGYLPAQLPDEALRTIIEDVISIENATSIKDMGRVIGAVGKRVAGQAEGARISKMVKELLA